MLTLIFSIDGAAAKVEAERMREINTEAGQKFQVRSSRGWTVASFEPADLVLLLDDAPHVQAAYEAAEINVASPNRKSKRKHRKKTAAKK